MAATETMSPREKVAAVLDPEIWADDMPVPTGAAVTDFHARRQASVIKADAILAALASSGDHAELARAIDRLLPITIHDTPDYAEVSFGECRAQAMTMEPDTWLALNQLPALIAEVAALRGESNKMYAEMAAEIHGLHSRAAEAERKLAEAVEKREGLEEDLYQAVLVAYRRGAVEWTMLNYPQWINAISAGREVCPPAPGAEA